MQPTFAIPAPPAAETPRLAPIDRPRSLFARLFFRISKKKLGKVMTPARIAYARMPDLVWLTYLQARTTERLSLEPELRFLVQSYVAARNGCAFCVDIARAVALRQETDVSKYDDLLVFERSPRFTPRERAALAYVEAITEHRRVPDATFDALRAHFNEREVVEITWLCALEHYYNLLNLPLGIGSDDLCALVRR